MAKLGDKFYTDMRGIHAEGIVTETGFLVLKGSEVRDFEAAYLSPRIVKMRRTALADGTIIDWKLTRDVEFNSTSTAAIFCLGLLERTKTHIPAFFQAFGSSG